MEISGESRKKEIVGKDKEGAVGMENSKKGKGTTGRGQKTGSHAKEFSSIYIMPLLYTRYEHNYHSSAPSKVLSHSER